MKALCDQAAVLRHSAPPPPAIRQGLACLAVASGKGGVGKTFAAVNLAIACHRLKRRVLLVDADFGLANADIALGVTPEHDLQEALFNALPLDQVVVHTPHGIDLLAAASGSRDMVALGAARLHLFAEELLRFAAGYDVLIFDCSAGIDTRVTVFLHLVPRVVVVTTPEPTSLVDIYALLKVIHQENFKGHVDVLLNMVEDEAEATRAMAKLRYVTDAYLKIEVGLLGWVPRSAAVQQAVHQRRPLLVLAPEDHAATRISLMAKRLLQKAAAPAPPMDWAGLLGGLVGRQAPEGIA